MRVPWELQKIFLQQYLHAKNMSDSSSRFTNQTAILKQRNKYRRTWQWRMYSSNKYGLMIVNNWVDIFFWLDGDMSDIVFK